MATTRKDPDMPLRNGQGDTKTSMTEPLRHMYVNEPTNVSAGSASAPATAAVPMPASRSMPNLVEYCDLPEPVFPDALPGMRVDKETFIYLLSWRSLYTLAKAPTALVSLPIGYTVLTYKLSNYIVDSKHKLSQSLTSLVANSSTLKLAINTKASRPFLSAAAVQPPRLNERNARAASHRCGSGCSFLQPKK